MDYKRRRLADRDEHGNKFCSGCKDWLPEGQFGSNAALGNLRDDESLLVKAIEYLRSYRD